MTRSLVLAASAITFGLSPLSAFSADPSQPRWFVSAIAGGNFLSDQTLEFKGGEGDPQGKAKASFDSGLLTGASVGYQLTPDLALVGEFTYQSVDHDGVTLPDSSRLPAGNYASTAFALQGIYSFNVIGSDRVRSYLGAGLAWLSEVDIDFEQGAREDSFSGDGVGVQVLAGARYELGPRFFLDAGLRYLAGGSVTLEPEGAATAGKVEADYTPWSVTVGLGWRF